MYVVLVVGLVAVIAVIVVYVVLSVRLGRDDDEDDVLEETPRGREQRGREDQRWADDRPRRVPAAAGRTASGRGGGPGSGYRERPADRDAGRSRSDYQRAGVGHDPGPGSGRRSSGGRDRSEARPQAGDAGRYGAAAQRHDTPRPARPAHDDYPSGDLGPLEFPTGDYPSAEFAVGDYPSGAFPQPDFPSGEFPSAEFAAVRAEKASDYPSGELSLARSSSRRADREAAPARRGGGDSRRKDGRQRESAKPQRSKRDDDDWGSTDWDKLSDEQYWAELSADKPLAATPRGAEPSGRSGPVRSDPGRSEPGRSDPSRTGGGSDSGAARRDAAKAKPPRPEPARPASAKHAGPRRAGPAREEQPREGAGEAPATDWAAERASRPAAPDLPTQRLPVRDRQQRRERPGTVGKIPGPAPEADEGSHEPGPFRPSDERSMAMLASLAGGPSAGAPADLMDDDPLTSPSFSRKAIPVLDSRSYASARAAGQTGPMPAIQPSPEQHPRASHPQPAEPYVYPAPVGGPGQDLSGRGLPGYQAAPYVPAPPDYAAVDYSGQNYQAAPAEPGYLPPAGYPAPEYGYQGPPPAPAIPSQAGEWYAAPAEPAPGPANPYAGYAETSAPAYAPDPAPVRAPGAPAAGAHPGDHGALYGYGYPEPTALGYLGMPATAIGDPSASAFPPGQTPVEPAPHLPEQGGWSAGYGGPAGAAIQGGYPDPYAPDGYGGYHPQG